MDEHAAPQHEAGPGPRDVDRLEALEQQVRQLTSRLAGWVEAQLVQALDDRRNDLKALRSELLVVVSEQLAGMRAETASILSVATRRLDVGQEQLGERLEAVEHRDARAAAGVEARPARGQGTAAADGLEQRVRQAMSRLTESVEAELVELRTARQTDADLLRRELTALVDERLAEVASRSGAGMAAVQDRWGQQLAALAERVDGASRQAASAVAGVGASGSEAVAATARIEAFEHRVKSAMGRLTDSVETRLAESAAGRATELDGLRADLGGRLETATIEAGRAREAAAGAGERAEAAGQRVEALEQQVRAAIARLGESVEAKTAELAASTAAGGQALRADLRTETGRQLREARAEMATAMDATHKRLAQSQEKIDERLRAMAGQVASVAGSVEILDTTVASDGSRLEALELHTRRTDAKLTDLVEERFATLASARGEELDRFRDELRNEISTAVARAEAQGAELRAAVDRSAAAARDELASTVELARSALAAGAERVEAQREELRAQVAGQVSDAAAELAAVLDAARAEVASGTVRLEEGQRELGTRLAEAAAASEAQSALQEAVAALGRRADRAQDRARKISDRIDQLAADLARAGSAESAALAPLRSDVRALQAQVAELAEALSARPSPRKAALAVAAPPAAKVTAAEKAQAVAARKAAIPAKPRSARPAAPAPGPGTPRPRRPRSQ